MSRDAEIILQMSKSLCIHESIGSWDNTINYYDDEGEEKEVQYSIQVFADYIHAVYHIGIGIDVLPPNFGQYADYIKNEAASIANKISKAKLNSVQLWFSGVVLIGTDKILANSSKIEKEFRQHGMCIRVYDTKSDNLPAIIPKIQLTPDILYDQEFIKGKKQILFNTPEYTIWENKDGSLNYALHMRLKNRFSKKSSILTDLSQLSPFRENVKQYLHSKYDRRRVVGGVASSLKDGLEGNIDSAKTTLVKVKEKARRHALSKVKFITFFVCSIIIGIGIIGLQLISGESEPILVAAIWGMIGAAMSYWVPSSRLTELATFSGPQTFADILIRMIIGAVSGAVVVFAIQSKILLGFIDVESGGPVYLIALVAGWSERILPKIFGRVEQSVFKDNEED